MLDTFYLKYRFNPKIDVKETAYSLLDDMKLGLSCKHADSTMDMIPLWKNIPTDIPKNKKVIVIDAGGTNFRTCIVEFDNTGSANIESFFKYPMPALEHEMTNEEFFDTIAFYLEPLKDKAEIISFCFSFAIKIYPDGGGEAIKLSKEIKLPYLNSCKINEELETALIKSGWQKIEKIIMVNDTAAVLQAGTLFRLNQKEEFDSNIGFVLGTGLNSAYIEYEKIEKLKDTEFCEKSQIIVCESGKSCRINQSLFDKELSEKSKLTNEYFLERMTSGKYLGLLCSIIIRKAASENIFSPDTNKKLLNIKDLTTEEVSLFLKEQNYEDNIFSDALNKNEISSDYINIYTICMNVFERASRCSAAVIAAACIKSGKGKSPGKPICISADGSMFLKGFMIKEKTTLYLHRFLKDELDINFKIITLKNSVILGTALSAFLK